MMVESMFSMNREQATIRGIRKGRGMVAVMAP
jgi:hypothetical protein